MVDVVVEVVEPRVADLDLELALPRLLEDVAHLVGQLARDTGSSRTSLCSRSDIRRGEKRSASSPRAYGRRHLEHVEVGVELDADRAERRDRLVEDHEPRGQAEVQRVDQVEAFADHLDRVDLERLEP